MCSQIAFALKINTLKVGEYKLTSSAQVGDQCVLWCRDEGAASRCSLSLQPSYWIYLSGSRLGASYNPGGVWSLGD